MTVPPHQPYDSSRQPSGNLPAGEAPHGRLPYGQTGYSGTGTPSAAVNGIGAIAGLVVALVALSVALIGAARGLLSRVDVAGVDALALLLVVLGFAMLAGVVVSGYWAPTAPLVPGIVLAVAGIVFMMWDQLLIDVYQLLPDSEAAHLFVLWGRTGVLLGVGALLMGAGALARLPRRPLRHV